MKMGWPQITLLVLYFVALMCSFRDDGKPRSNESFGRTLLSVLINLFLLWEGGFF